MQKKLNETSADLMSKQQEEGTLLEKLKKQKRQSRKVQDRCGENGKKSTAGGRPGKERGREEPG